MTPQTHGTPAPGAVENEPPQPGSALMSSDAESEGHSAERHEPQGLDAMPLEVVADGSRDSVAAPPCGKPGRSGPPGNRNARKHGSSRAAADLKELVRRSMDGRTTEAREVAEWLGDLAGDLGGADQLSTQQRTLAELAGQTWLQLRRVDAFIAAMPAIAHRKRRQLYPIVTQRTTLANTLRQLLGDLGLERRARDVTDLASYLAARAQPAPPVAATEAPARDAETEDVP